MCSKCGKRPAIVFVSEMNSTTSSEPKGYCLVCAKEAGIKPINDMIKSMNLTDEDIEGMNEQIMEFMDPNAEGEDFEMGGVPTFPFLNNIFGTMSSEDNNTENTKEDKKEKKQNKKDAKKGRFLSQYCTNLTKRAKDGELDNIIGREDELYRTIQILSRRSKNNPCLIGEPGVGKTAIAEGLAIKIVNGDAPARLQDKEIHLLDMTSLVAGTQFRGQFESRVKGLIDDIKNQGNVILAVLEPNAGFRTRYQYNNLFFVLLGYLEERVRGGMPWEEQIVKYIAEPLAMIRPYTAVTATSRAAAYCSASRK